MPRIDILPRRRSDLVLRALGDGQNVVKDPVKGSYFNLGEQEFFLLNQLDGIQSPSEIRASFERRFAESLSADDLDGFVDMVRERGLMQGLTKRKSASRQEQTQAASANANHEEIEEEPEEAAPRRSRQSILFYRYSLYDPDAFFNWLEPRIRWVWTAEFLALSAAAIAAAFLVVVTNRQELVSSFPQAVHWESLALAWLILVLATTCHEFAHGLTCKHYGGEVHEVGVLLMFFTPCFFCNISDAWLMREKSKRLWITLAGGYCDLCLWSMAVFVWRVTMQDTLLNYMAWVIRGVSRRGVHVITVNQYLAQRDHELLSPVLRLLGITAGLLPAEPDPVPKRLAYACDVTYGAGTEFIFDYLRDRVAMADARRRPLGEAFRSRLREPIPRETMQRGLVFAILDEADSVLIDEARSPLILSGQSRGHVAQSAAHAIAQEISRQMRPDVDFQLDPVAGQVRLTDAGESKVYALPQQAPLASLDRPWMEYVEQALQAQFVLQRDVHYVVQNGEVVLVSQHTGRLANQCRWSEGLHQAVEAKERLSLTPEHRAIARTTVQRFFCGYEGLCGMTGTAAACAREFDTFYGLTVRAIPLRKRSRMDVLPSRIFATSEQKLAAVVEEIERIHRLERPLLVGTRTIAGSEQLAALLRARQLEFQLLNGVQDAGEAAIVARAGLRGEITIATNMAGRGTDIALGDEVAARDGLHVIGTEMHLSQRLDRQLIGRAGRQGDPGSAQFFLSADDELIRLFDPALSRWIRRHAMADGKWSVDFSSRIEALQRRIDRMQFKQRLKLRFKDDRQEAMTSQLETRSRAEQ